MKKLIAFDIDGTLAPSKSVLPKRMAELLSQLLEDFEVCIISGGKYELFQRQVMTQITDDPQLLKKLHLMPTSGTRYYSYDMKNRDWKLEYAEDFTAEERKKIIKALEEGLEESGHKAEKTYGDIIEDRGSQVTLSVFGQDIIDVLGDEGLRIKEEWDPDSSKKHQLRKAVAPKIPEFQVRVGGLTGVDVTKPGVDKAYGMEKLMTAAKLEKDDILYMGDRIVEGGNDYAVYKMGIDCISVRSWEDTAYAVEGIVKVI
jgi:HAD superfamily hydrolase (TIGR01484 family)